MSPKTIIGYVVAFIVIILLIIWAAFALNPNEEIIPSPTPHVSATSTGTANIPDYQPSWKEGN